MFLINSIKTSEAFLLLIRQISVPAILLTIAVVLTQGRERIYLVPYAFVLGTAYVAWEQYRYQLRKNLSAITTKGSYTTQPERGRKAEALTEPFSQQSKALSNTALRGTTVDAVTALRGTTVDTALALISLSLDALFWVGWAYIIRWSGILVASLDLNGAEELPYRVAQWSGCGILAIFVILRTLKDLISLWENFTAFLKNRKNNGSSEERQ